MIDWDALRENFSNRNAFIIRILNKALTGIGDAREKLSRAAEQKNMEDIAFSAHGTKGIAGNMMAKALFDKAVDTEVKARKNNPDVYEDVDELLSLMDCFISEVKAELKVK